MFRPNLRLSLRVMQYSVRIFIDKSSVILKQAEKYNCLVV